MDGSLHHIDQLDCLAAASHGDLGEVLHQLEALHDLPRAGALTMEAIGQLLDKVERLTVRCHPGCRRPTACWRHSSYGCELSVALSML